MYFLTENTFLYNKGKLKKKKKRKKKKLSYLHPVVKEKRKSK